MPRPATGKTPVRNLRVPDDLWRAAQARAAERGETLTDAITAFLRRYVARGRPDRSNGGRDG